MDREKEKRLPLFLIYIPFPANFATVNMRLCTFTLNNDDAATQRVGAIVGDYGANPGAGGTHVVELSAKVRQLRGGRSACCVCAAPCSQLA